MKSSHCTAFAVALAMPLLAVAQRPTSASAPSSGLQYPSAFTGYKPYEDIPAGNWRALNDTVRDAGGTMANGMAMSPSAAAAASASASAPSKPVPKAPMKRPMGQQMPGGMK
jgi:hypothetical protein